MAILIWTVMVLDYRSTGTDQVMNAIDGIFASIPKPTWTKATAGSSGVDFFELVPPIVFVQTRWTT